VLNRQLGTVASSSISGPNAWHLSIVAPWMAARYCSTGPSLVESDMWPPFVSFVTPFHGPFANGLPPGRQTDGKPLAASCILSAANGW
jgi:hypothetical protein